MKHLTNMNGHLETPVTRGSAYNKRKSLNLASNMARRQNSAGGADRFVPSEFDEAGGYTKLAGIC